MNLTVQDLLGVQHIEERGVTGLGAAKTFRDVSTDSRQLRRGDLFVALRGERFDGHEYLAAVAEQGAMAAIVDKKYLDGKHPKLPQIPLFVVESTLDAYGQLANIYRKKFSIPILAIGGSNGKTTTKELVAAVLSATRGVLKTEENFNNQIGVPRMLFQLRDGHEIAVLELGTNHPGEIAWLTKVAEPTHAMLTNIGREHLEFFKDLKGVAEEERSLFAAVAESGGVAFVNLDDKYLRPAQKQFGDRAVTYGIDQTAYVHAHIVGHTKDGRLEVRVAAEGKSFKLRTHLVADYGPNLIAGAVAIGLHFKMRRAEIKAAIERFRPADKRLEVQRLFNGVVVLNDCYNANPDSMESAFRSLANYPGVTRRIVVLGDMFELGESTAKEHRALGRKLNEFNFERHYFIGPAMEAANKSFLGVEGEGKGTSAHFKDKETLIAELRATLETGDAVLVKGSRGMKMEEIVDAVSRP